MSLRDVLINVTRPLSLLDQSLGIALMNDNLLHPHGTLAGPIQSGYIRPWRHIPGHKSGTSSIQLDKDAFMVNLDVQQFQPGEVTVKTTDGGHVIVEGVHDERPDEHGFVSRRFARRYVLPPGVERDRVTSTLSPDGVLTVRAPRTPTDDQKSRVIPIVHTQASAIN